VPTRPPHRYRPDPRKNGLQNALEVAHESREKARRLAATLGSHWDAAVDQRDVPPQVWLSVKSILEDLDSALDYVAAELQRRGLMEGQGKAYFPIALPGQSRTSFRVWLRATYGGLEANAPAVEYYLTEIQHFERPDEGWLHQLRDLCQVLKHQGPPHQHLNVFRGTVSKEGYETRNVAEFTLQFEGFDGDLSEFLVHAAEATTDIIRCLRDALRAPLQRDPSKKLMEVMVNGDHHATVVMKRSTCGPGSAVPREP
jgi:hypothetical protein